MEHDGIVNPIITSGPETGSLNHGTARTDQPPEGRQGRSSAEDDDDGEGKAEEEEEEEEEEEATTKATAAVTEPAQCNLRCCLKYWCCCLKYWCCCCYCCCCYCCCFIESARGIIWDHTKILTRNVWVIFCAVVWNKFFYYIFDGGSSTTSFALCIVLPLLFILVTTVALPFGLGNQHTREVSSLQQSSEGSLACLHACTMTS